MIALGCFTESDGLEVTMECKEFMIVGGSAGTQVGINEGNMVRYDATGKLWDQNVSLLEATIQLCLTRSIIPA